MTHIEFAVLALLIGICAVWVKKQQNRIERKIDMTNKELADGLAAIDNSVKAVAAAIAAEGDKVPQSVADAFTQLQTDVGSLAAQVTPPAAPATPAA